MSGPPKEIAPMPAITLLPEGASGAPVSKEAMEKMMRETAVKNEQTRAHGVVEKLKQNIFPEPRKQKNLDAPVSDVLNIAMATTKDKWLLNEKKDVPEDPMMQGVLLDILSAPAELRNDPTWLLAKGAEIRSVLKADMSHEQQMTAGKALRNIFKRIVQLEGVNMGNDAVRYSIDPEVAKKVQFVELAGNALLPEAGVMPPRPPRTPAPAPADLGESWLDYDSAGRKIPEVTHPRLKAIIQNLRHSGGVTGYEGLEDAYKEIKQQFLDPSLTPEQRDAVEAEARPYMKTMREAWLTGRGGRFHPTPEDKRRIQKDPVFRDEQFYLRLRKLLTSTNEEAHRVMGLYEEADLDVFMDIVANMDQPDEHGKPVGETLERLYENRKQTIMRLHDVDYWARHAGGDIKSYKGTVTQIQNYHAVDALSDPYVETMRNCYEKALLFIRSTHGGYIPAGFMTTDPLKLGQTEWDEIAMKFFRAKAEGGELFDVQRDPETGLPLTDASHGGRVFKLAEKATTLQDLEGEDGKGGQALRIRASQEMAKGLLCLDMRTFEIVAMSKTPGFGHPEFGIDSPGFTSKPYGQLARWFNPVAEWFGKYHMGKTLHKPFFQTMVEGKATSKWWDNERFEKAFDAMMDGTITEQFGDDAKRFIDMVESMSFSGRFGPLSKWGTRDATIGWTDMDKERLGGSMRMSMSDGWAEGQVKAWFKREHPGHPDSWYESMWQRELHGDKDGPVKKVLNVFKKDTDHHHHESIWGERVKDLRATYRSWLWVQMTSRHPTIVAGFLKEKVMVGGKEVYRPIRDRILAQVLHEDFSMMEDYYKDSSHTPNEDMRRKMYKLAELEADVDMVQQRAMNMRDGKPRDIEDADFNIIDNNLRRQQAKEYWIAVKHRVLGEWTTDQWYEKLGVNDDYRRGLVKQVSFGNAEHPVEINEVLAEAAGPKGSERQPMITRKLVDRPLMQHMSLEDVQWRFLDIDTLGPPHWARRAGDLEARIGSVGKMIEYVDALTAHPDQKDLTKRLLEVLDAEKNHDPKEGYKEIYLLAKATGDLYRQTHWGNIPILGKVAQTWIPSSIAQKYFETAEAAAWSANNERKFVDGLVNGGIIPKEAFYQGEYWGEYHGHRLYNELGATQKIQIAEMVIIGMGIAYLATIILALTQSTKEETSSHH